MNSSTAADATVPLNLIKQFEHESLRWPPHLDHREIVRRLVVIRESGESYRDDLGGLTRLLEDVESMSPAQLASRVIAALEWTAEHPGHRFLAKQLQIVAVNLKNLG